MYRILIFFLLLSAVACNSTTNNNDTTETSTDLVDNQTESADRSKNRAPVSLVVDVKTFDQLIKRLSEEEADFQILDVRSPAEILQTGKIRGAFNLDWNDGRFEAEYGALNPELPTLVYCQSGRRSGNARNLMIENNFKEVYDLKGGIAKWIDDGKPVIKKQQ